MRLDRSSPIADARLADGSRVHAVLPPLAPDGPCLTIRRFAARPVELDAFGVGEAGEAFLRAAVQGGWNLLVAGATSAGKTTLLNALSAAIDAGERIVTIEETAELRLAQPHVVRLEARPANAEGAGAIGVRDLVRCALRMRPDRIVVGEVRGGEALDMLQALNTGHDGSLSTVHANGPADALSRLETLVLLAGVALADRRRASPDRGRARRGRVRHPRRRWRPPGRRSRRARCRPLASRFARAQLVRATRWCAGGRGSPLAARPAPGSRPAGRLAVLLTGAVAGLAVAVGLPMGVRTRPL